MYSSALPKDISNAERIRIVVLDDSLELLQLLKMLLEDEGYSVETMSSTDGAHARVIEENPALIILDLVLDTPNAGWEFLQVLKLDSQTKDIPVIIYSAAPQVLSSVKERIDELGWLGCYILPKPFDIEHLVNMVHLALGDEPI